jgi:hypothetical protein
LFVEAVSSHPPLRERIARLQVLIGAVPGTVAPSDLTDDQLRAKFSESARFVQNAASTDPEVMAKIMQSALLALPGGRRLLEKNIGGTQIHRESTSRDPIEQKLHESNLASTGDSIPDKGLDSSLPPVLAADPPSVIGIGLPDSAAKEALELAALAKMLGPVAASMQPKNAATQPAAAERPNGSSGTFLFWIVIALSAGAIVAALAIK